MPQIPTLPRLPGIPDPLRRIRLPDDLEAVTTIGAEEDPTAVGLEAPAVADIWKAAVDLYRSGVHPAVQVCVRRHGKVVLNRAIGHARGNGPNDTADAERVLASPATPFLIYSGAKGVTAFVVHLAAERGAIDLEDPVAKYIPDYAANGKGEITIAHVLAHRAGVANLPREAFDLDRIEDREFLLDVLCSAKPFGKPGEFLAYHAVSGGFILAEVIRRATGQDIQGLLSEAIRAPLGFRWTNYGVRAEDIPVVAVDYVTGPPTLPPFSQLLTRALGVSLDELVELSRDPRFLTAVVPSANVVTTAEELSLFYEIFRRGGELDGVRVVRPETVRRAITEQSRLEIDLSLGFPTRFGYGLMLGAAFLSLFGRDTQHAFGHLGFTNMLAWADPQRALSCAVMTNGKPTVYPELPRLYNLMQRITSSAPKVPGDEMEVWDPLAGRPS
ncbi:MAG TPA: serine hydrolase domain-containing protein [Solirubrobacteraceae bacterium]|nr:serine hydrolase domain-containing protein [Solirubrobacteraceae bacterium]